MSATVLATSLATSRSLRCCPVDRSRSGMVSGVLNTSREAGSAIGVALSGALTIGGTVAGIQAAIVLSALLLVLAAGIASLGIRRDTVGTSGSGV